MTTETITQIPLDQLHESPFNHRTVYKGLEELAANIMSEGRIHEPLLVRPRLTNPLRDDLQEGFEIVFGHRRFRAAEIAGLATVPCMVAALFCRAGSVYKSLPGVDVWDEARDARGWPGGVPLVAHPPCRLWAKLRQFAKAKDPAMERQLAIDAVRRVQRFGGVLEHPAESTLWAHDGLPTPGRAPDKHGGWTAEVNQCDWGHKAQKRTWLYIVGCHPDDLPQMPPPGKATGLIKPKRGQPRDGRKIVTKAEREHTPPAFAAWLVELARRCQVRHNAGINRRPPD